MFDMGHHYCRCGSSNAGVEGSLQIALSHLPGVGPGPAVLANTRVSCDPNSVNSGKQRLNIRIEPDQLSKEIITIADRLLTTARLAKVEFKHRTSK